MTKSIQTPAVETPDVFQAFLSNLPETFEISDSSNDVVTITRGENWNLDFITQILHHAFKQKVNDAGASALADTVPAHIIGKRVGANATAARKEWLAQGDNADLVAVARHDMRAAQAVLMSNGEWGVVRQGGETQDPAIKGRRSTCYEWMYNAGSSDALKARLAYKAIDPKAMDERNAFRDDTFATHAGAIMEWKIDQLGF
jgi:hypothetical protein